MTDTDRWHFIGIGGIGMSGLARILLERDASVSGSDLRCSATVSALQDLGAEVAMGQKADNVQAGMTIVYSTAVKESNPELSKAKELGCILKHRSELLAELSREQKTLAVAGSHGKTSTSALLSHVLLESGWDPSYAVGGILGKQQCNAGWGRGEHFVLEADESDGSFLRYTPEGAIVTNIEPEHLDHYGSVERVYEDFRQFMSQVQNPRLCLWCADDPALKSMGPEGSSYGFSADAELRASSFRQNGWELCFDAEIDGRQYSQITLSMPGKHNALNALAVFGLALRLGVTEDAIRQAFQTFQGIHRRCQRIGEKHHILFIDDYAHHPTEIEATLSAIRQAVGPRRIIALYQPHRYSRTKDTQGMYKNVFRHADQVLVTDIYSAGEPPIPGISHETVLKDIQEASWPPSRYASQGGLVEGLSQLLQPHDVLVTMGAGDVGGIAQEMMEEIEQELPERLTVGVIFGGRSLEHDIAIASARHICELLIDDDYDVKQFGVTRDGEWVHGPDVVDLMGMYEEMQTDEATETVSADILAHLLKCDVFFPVFHGPFGEDGMIQGFLETLGIPYVGSDYRAAALCTDKAFVKRVMMASRIPTAPFVSFSYTEWAAEREDLLLQIAERLVFPLFVKSAHYGSSIGVFRVESMDALPETIERALFYDTHVLVEEGIQGRELEFAVLGNDWLHVPPPAEILSDGRLYDYGAKYRKGGITVQLHADLSPELLEEGQQLAAKCFHVAGCAGMGTVSFFLDDDKQYWFNEIDPTPGFTRVSPYGRVWESNGLETKDLLSQLLVLALHRKRWQEKVFSRTLGRNKPRYDG